MDELSQAMELNFFGVDRDARLFEEKSDWTNWGISPTSRLLPSAYEGRCVVPGV